MGNNTAPAEMHPDAPIYNDIRTGVHDKTKDKPFKQLPTFIGPINKGHYYHINDVVSKNNSDDGDVPFKFKYNAIDFEYKQNQNNINPTDEDDDDDDEKKNNNHNNVEMSTYQKSRYEWVWITIKDGVASHKIKEPTYFDKKLRKDTKLPDEYEQIRNYLAENDPIPPYFMRKTRMAGKVFDGAWKSSLRNVSALKCRIAEREVGDNISGKVYHPALLIWNRKDSFPQFSDSTVMIVHLKKLPSKYLTDENDENKQIKKEQIEIECRPISKDSLDNHDWIYEQFNEQNLTLDNGLLDIAHWCLKYEIQNEYKYEKYMGNCRVFMVALCKTFKIKHDAQNWTDTVVYMANQASSPTHKVWKY